MFYLSSSIPPHTVTDTACALDCVMSLECVQVIKQTITPEWEQQSVPKQARKFIEMQICCREHFLTLNLQTPQWLGDEKLMIKVGSLARPMRHSSKSHHPRCATGVELQQQIHPAEAHRYAPPVNPIVETLLCASICFAIFASASATLIFPRCCRRGRAS